MKNKNPIANKALLVGTSKKNSNYRKYLVTYTDSNNVERTIPAYGKNMQEALRKVNKEINYKILVEKYEFHSNMILVLFIIVIVSIASILISGML